MKTNDDMYIGDRRMNKPTRCIDPVMKFCQGCKYGYCIYPVWVETADDLQWCTFESGCIYGFEDTVPTKEELKEFESRWK